MSACAAVSRAIFHGQVGCAPFDPLHFRNLPAFRLGSSKSFQKFPTFQEIPNLFRNSQGTPEKSVPSKFSSGRSSNPNFGSINSRMTLGFIKLTTYEQTENLNPGNTSSVTAAPPSTCRRSRTSTFFPALERYAAAVRPLWPPPITIASYLFMLGMNVSFQGRRTAFSQPLQLLIF